MNVLVTGANGFVGAMLCRKLLERGDTVRGLVRKTSDLTLLQDQSVETVTGSLDDSVSLKYAAQNIDVVYHVAAAVSDWGSLEYFREVNVEGTQNLLDASVEAGVKRFVLVSSVVVHSFIGSDNMNETSPQLPTPFPYCQTKREAESLVIDYYHREKIDVSIVRPGDVFGPGDRTSLLKMRNLIEKGRLAYVGGGRILGAFTYVENLADGIILAGTKKEASGEAFVITDGIRLTWREYLIKLTDAIGAPHPRVSISPCFAYAVATVSEWTYKVFGITSRPFITRYLISHLRRDFHFNIDKARRVLGYEPAVPIDKAIQKTARWYCQEVR